MDINKNQKKLIKKIPIADILFVGGETKDKGLKILVEKLKTKKKNSFWIQSNYNAKALSLFSLDQFLENAHDIPYFSSPEELYDKRREFYFALGREAQDGIYMHHVEFEFNLHLSISRFILRESKAKRVIFANVPHQRWQIAFTAACKIEKVDFISLLPTVSSKIRGISKLNLCVEYRNMKICTSRLIKHSIQQHKKLKIIIDDRNYFIMKSLSNLEILKKKIKAKLINILPVLFLVTISKLIWRNIENLKKNFKISKDFSLGMRRHYSRSLYFENLKKKIIKLKKLYEEYNINSVDIVNFNERFVYYPLHYQPEATTMPMGSLHVDQLNIAISLATKLKDLNIKLVVKEHPGTFLFRLRGEKGRFKSFYNELNKHPNIILASYKVKSEEILKKSDAVISLTGTASIEKSAIGGLGILFGSHYALKSYSTLFRVDSVSDAVNLVEYFNKKKIKLNKLDNLSAKRLVFDIEDKKILNEIVNVLINDTKI